MSPLWNVAADTANEVVALSGLGRDRSERVRASHTRSMIEAVAMPCPMHITCSP